MRVLALLMVLPASVLARPPLDGLRGSMEGLVYISPMAGSDWQSPVSRIILGFDRPVPDLRVTLAGSEGGPVGHSSYITADGCRIVLTPDRPFLQGETVSVDCSAGSSGSIGWSFVVRPLDPVRPVTEILREPWDPLPQGGAPPSRDAVAVPSDFPAITFSPSGSQAPGSLFFTPYIPAGTNPSNYLIMASSSGEILFYRNSPQVFMNAEVQQDGCLSYALGGLYSDSIRWIELDQTYSKVDSFAVVGYNTDIHDFTVADNDDLLLIGEDLRYMDLSGVVPGGSTNALVMGLLIQEQDRNHQVVFQWSSFDHFEITDACDYVDLTGDFVDYVHCNSIDEDADGGLIVSCCAMTECTKIDRTTGDIVWRFGGYLSDNPDFTIVDDPLGGFSSQHDFRHVSGNLYSVFDNGSHRTPHISRGLVYALDTQSMTATLVRSFQITGLWGTHMGSTQILQGGDMVIGWGDVNGVQARPDITEVNSAGTVVFSGRMNNVQLESYRAYRFDWTGQALVPYLVAMIPSGQNHVQLTYNVFGTQQFASYDIYRGSSPGSLSFLTSTPNRQIDLWALPIGMNYFAVKARDMQGVPTGFSNIDSALVTWTGVSAETSLPLARGLTVSPNPAHDGATAVWSAPADGTAALAVMDVSGRCVLELETLAGADGIATAVIPACDLPAGVYIVTPSGLTDPPGAVRLVVIP